MPDDAPLSDAERELLSRRKDLEREFDEKTRDLKAQHKRQADKLQQDRLEWESYKKGQAKALADQAERLHRKVDNTVRAEATKAATQEEVAALKARVQELEEERLKAKVARETLEKRNEALAQRARSASSVLAGLSFVAVVGAASWLLLAVQDGGSLVEPGIFLAVTAVMVVAAVRVRLTTP
jgi:hypothetical protein